MSIIATIGKRNESIKVISVEGHSNAIDKKSDYKLVCAGVSSVMVGLLNAIDELEKDSCEITLNESENPDTNHITIVVTNDSKDLQLILKVGEIQLKTIELNYNKYLDLKITEV